MNGVTRKRAPEYQTSRIRLLARIVLNHLAVKNRKVDFIEPKAIVLGLLIGVVRNTNPPRSDRLLNVPDVHARPLARTN